MQSIIGEFFPLIIMFGLFIYMIWSNSRREKKKKEEILNSLNKGVRVQTIGGINGTIVEVKDSEVLLNVDPVTNTRISFSKSAISGILT